jgi:hypothetical protein
VDTRSSRRRIRNKAEGGLGGQAHEHFVRGVGLSHPGVTTARRHPATRSGNGRTDARLSSRFMSRKWYLYIVGALLYASAMALGNFVLFLIGTAIVIAAVVVGEVDRKTAHKAQQRGP